MKHTTDWSDLLATLAKDIPEEELEADILLADIAGKISAERIKRNLSQQAFAELLGVTQSQVSKIENGDNNFTIRRLIKIAHKLKIPLKILFGEKPILQTKTVYSNATTSHFMKGKNDAYSNVIFFPSAFINSVNYPDLKEQ